MAPLILNSAHANSNYTCLAFSHDGSKLYTGGEHSYVRIWRSDLGGEQEPDVAVENEGAITCVATSKKYWLSGGHDACVRTYDAQGLVMEGLVTRTVAVPVRCVAIDPKGQRVAVTSDELEVKVIDMNDITNIKKLDGHRKGVRRATWHPSGTLLTTCGSDGDIIVWDVSPGEEPKPVKTITGIIPAVDSESPDFVYDCSAVWHPSGKYFAVASRAHEIVTVSRMHWQKSSTFSDDNVTGAVTALALSPNGTYLASATPSGVFIWSTATHNVLFRHVPSVSFALVSHLAFSPTQNLLAWTDSDGTLTRWPEPIPSTSPDPVNTQATSSKMDATSKKWNVPLSFDKYGVPGPNTHRSLDDQAGDDEYGMDNEDWMIDDIGLLDKAEKEKDQTEGDYAREMVSVTKAQPAFQPASTPMANKKRYLAFNMIGVIEVTDQDMHHIVNVEFHDRSTRVGFHFQDTSKCELASLGERGALYACQSESNHPAQIMYRPYSTWGSSGDWQYTLPLGETVVALAAGGTSPSRSLRNKSSEGDVEGNGNVVVATSRGFLRFMTGGGIQRYLWALGADVITMVAGREWVFVVHRDGGTSLDGCQNLAYTLVSLDTFIILQHGRLPVPKGRVLRWIGISEEGAPAMYDSNGLLYILDRFRRPDQARWTPILDTTALARRQGKDESYWPVGVSGTLFMCIILKGREAYPGFPRPLIQELEIQMPLLNLDVPWGQMEERFLREELHIGVLRDALGSDLTTLEISQREVALDKELIQLIQLACKGDRLQRALDAAALLHHTQSFDMAIKVAQFYHLVGLQEKLTALKSERTEVDRLREEKEARKNWGKQSTPIVAPRNHAQSLPHSHFEEFAPPSASIRKSLAPAKPVIANNCAYGNNSSVVGSDSGSVITTLTTIGADASVPSPWDSSEAETSFALDGKRKRSEQDTSGESLSDEDSVSKKRALLPRGISKPKPSPNPFARKPQDTKSNPFPRSVSKLGLATKSNSFFDKVDEVNDIASQPKATSTRTKEKQDAPRQTTLFGPFPRPHLEKTTRKRSSKGSKNDGDTVKTTETLSTHTYEAGVPHTQATEATIIDVSPVLNEPESDQLPPDNQKTIET